MINTADETTDHIKAMFSKWLKPLGLLWWKIDVRYYELPSEVIHRFGNEEERIIAARTFADWRYGEATIDINLLAFMDMTVEEIERAIVHECMHILVNEMREGEIHHEERVVTTLTKAIFWTSTIENLE